MGLALIGPLPGALADVPTPHAKPKLLVISEKDCRRLSRHWPRNDVAFKPGFGVDGQPVSPADINGGFGDFNLPPEVSFNLLIRLREGELLEPEGTVGQVSVDLATGVARLNDDALLSKEQQALVAFCQSL